MVALLACNASFLNAQDREGLMPDIDGLLREQQLSGAVWSVVQQGSITTYSAGVKNLKTGEVLEPSDRVHVGSIAKTVVALGILRLATEGKINLDDPVKYILPELPLKNPWEEQHPVTIRHLLDHTSGLSDLRLWHFFSSTAEPDTPLEEFYTRNPAVLTVHAEPGSLFSYSNMGYTVLGMVVEKITGQRYEVYLDEFLLKPLGLHHSTFQFITQVGAARDRTLAMGHFDNGITAPALPIYVRPAGQFTTTANDMGLLIRFILRKGKLGDASFIDSTYFENYGKPAYTMAGKGGLHNGYALGLALRDRHGVTGITHSGNIIGYHAMLYIFPEAKKGFFIAHNMDSETADYEVFNKALIEHLDIPRIVASMPTQPTTDFEAWNGYYVPVITKVEPLAFLDRIGSFTKIRITPAGAEVLPFQSKALVLSHLGDGLFRQEDRVSPSHLLYAKDGKHYFTTGIRTQQQISGIDIALLAASVILWLLAVAVVLVSGIYHLVRFRLTRVSPVLWSFAALVLLLVGTGSMAMHGFTYVGDLHAGSVLVCMGSVLLPVLSLLALVVYLRTWKTAIRSINFWAMVLIIQFSLVLFIYGAMPVVTWR